MKSIKSLLIIFSITIILLEIVAKFYENRLEVYNIWPVSELNKKKEIVLKKNFEIHFTDFSVFTDQNRLRVKSSDQNRIIEKKNQKILLIGDSLPFGWNVNYENSIGGNLEKLSNYLILNGAIPSYSLKQSRIRLEEYLINFKNIKLIYFQALDPALQYSTMKGDWDEDINWSNMNYITNLKEKFIFKYDSVPIYGEINIIKIIQKIYLKYFYQESKKVFTNRSNYSDSLFKNHIQKEIEKIYEIKSKKSILVLGSPVTKEFFRNISNNNLNTQDKVLLKYGAELKQFGKEYKDVFYIDFIKIFEGYTPDQIFIDNCCHFSPTSNKIIAENLINILKNY